MLGLILHKIGYEELVAEGIKPIVLRQLYEEVGIKVPTPQQGEAINGSNVDKSHVDARPPNSPMQNVGRPLERKDMIAQKLAEKAAKMAKPAQPPETGVEGGAAVENLSEKTDAVAPAGTGPVDKTGGKENEARLHARHKEEETERVRLRTEELCRRREIEKAPEPAQVDAASGNASRQEELAISSNAPSRHSLNRSPVPHPPVLIPGLSMPERGPGVKETLNPVQTSAAATRTSNPRKRPRASDFDGPVDRVPISSFTTGTEGNAQEGRLVIDISDDDEGRESDTDVMEVDSSDRIDRSRAPQSNEETLQQKTLKIQEMRRRIAKLEEMKRAKGKAVSAPVVGNEKAAATASVAVESGGILGIQNGDVSGRLGSMSSEEREHLRMKLVEKGEVSMFLSKMKEKINVLAARLAQLESETRGFSLEEFEGGMFNSIRVMF